jgi:hypothetical protein
MLPPHLLQRSGELWLTYVDRLSEWETTVRTLPPEDAEKFVKRLIVERAVQDKRDAVRKQRNKEDAEFLQRIEERRSTPSRFQNCELHPVTLNTVNFEFHEMSYFCNDCWRGICPLCFGSCCRNHNVWTVEAIIRGVEDSITRAQEQRCVFIREEERKILALNAVRERCLAWDDKDNFRQAQLGVKRCNQRINLSDQYIETLRSELSFLTSRFHLPCVGNSKSASALDLKEWFQRRGVGFGANSSDKLIINFKPDIVDPSPHDVTEAFTQRALVLYDEPADDDTPPVLIAIEPQKS